MKTPFKAYSSGRWVLECIKRSDAFGFHGDNPCWFIPSQAVRQSGTQLPV